MANGTYNKVILMGNLGKDPEVRFTPKGTPCATVSLATTERFKDSQSGEFKERAEWHNVVLWAGLAKVAQEYLKKGHKIHIEGRLQTRNFDDKETGKKVYRTEVVVSELQMLGGPRSPEEKEGAAYQNTYNNGAPVTADGIPEEPIPF